MFLYVIKTVLYRCYGIVCISRHRMIYFIKTYITTSAGSVIKQICLALKHS